MYDNLTHADHQRLIRRMLNAAVVLCEDHCIAPPGFIVEDVMAFELAESQRAYLQSGILQFPMRENNLAEFAEKKRIGYEPMRNRYSGLFDDTRIGFLGANATGIINRRSHITENILRNWQAGPDTGQKIWAPVKKVLRADEVAVVSRIPIVLNEQGTALTWAAIQPKLADEIRRASPQLRDALQHIYFKEYCSEFGLIVLTHLPHMPQDFMLPRDGQVYSYRRLEAFLDAFGVKDMVLGGSARLIVELRKRTGFIGFIDAFAGIATIAISGTDLKFHADRARKATSFNWTSVANRRATLFDLNPVEIAELDDAFREAASVLTQQHGLPVREVARDSHDSAGRSTPIQITAAEPDLIFFVALGEELDVLTTALKLARHTGCPEASGRINDSLVDVVCPRKMGRVAAATAMTTYLASRKSPPKLILILGIAGGFVENGTQEGHIVCATKIVDLAIRKIVEGDKKDASPKFRRDDYPMSDALRRVIESDAFDENQWSSQAAALGWPDGRHPSIYYGSMASGDEIVSSDKWRGEMLGAPGGDEKLLGVEMEAGGVCAAAASKKVPVCMLRAISDMADPSKADNAWRSLGMNTIAILIGRLPLDEVLKHA